MTTITKPEPEWFEDWSNVTFLLRYLAEQPELDKDDIVRAAEKPWQYEEDYQTALKEYEREQAEEAEQHRRMGPQHAF